MFLVSLSVSGVCLGIYTIISPEAGFGFALVYVLCWAIKAVGVSLDRLCRRPSLPNVPEVFELLREFGTGRLTLALVGLSFRFVLPDNATATGDRWMLAIMALAVFSALQGAYNDITAFSLPRAGLIRSLLRWWAARTGGARL